MFNTFDLIAEDINTLETDKERLTRLKEYALFIKELVEDIKADMEYTNKKGVENNGK